MDDSVDSIGIKGGQAWSHKEAPAPGHTVTNLVACVAHRPSQQPPSRVHLGPESTQQHGAPWEQGICSSWTPWGAAASPAVTWLEANSTSPVHSWT